MHWTSVLLSALVGYLIGSIPSGVVIGRLLGVDVTLGGSGHTGAMNVARTTRRLWPAVLTALVDVLWGVLPVVLARRWFPAPWSPAIAGILAIVGHNWSAYLRLRGGVGISTFCGTILGLSPFIQVLLAAAALLVLWFALHAALRHTARTTTLAGFAVGPLLWALGAPANALLVATVGALPVIIQSARDWNRVYEPKEQHER